MVVLVSCSLAIESGEEYFDVDYDFDKLVELSKDDYDMLSDEEKKNIELLTVAQYKIDIPEDSKNMSSVDLCWSLYRNDISCPQFDLKTKWFTDGAIVKQVRIV